MKNLKNPLIILALIATLIFAAACGDDDEDDRREKEREQQIKQQEEYLKTPEGKAEHEKYLAEQKKKEEEEAYREKVRKDLEYRERFFNNPVETVYLDFMNKYEDIPESEPEEIFKIGSDLAVNNGAKNAVFTLDKAVYATELWTYHYNNGNGAPDGEIGLLSDDGYAYGPWPAETQNIFYWRAKPNTTLPAGTYTVFDSDPSTWAHNKETNGMGMTWMNGIYN